MTSKKKLTVVVIMVIGLIVVEIGRELAVYLSWSRYYEKAYWTIEERRHEDTVTKGELKETAGMPTSVVNDGAETWNWEARRHVGPILRLVPLPLTRHPYRLTVELDPDGFVKDVYAGVD